MSQLDQQERREAETEQQRQQRIAAEQADGAAVEARRKADAEAKAKRFPIDLALSAAPGGPASPAEAERIHRAMAQVTDPTPERALATLLTLREIAGKKPDWVR